MTLYRKKPLTLFIRYALPQMAGLLLNSVYLIVDGLFIGNRLGRDAMAAAAVSVPMLEALIALSLGVAVGGGIIISSNLGKGDTDAANRAFNVSILVAVMISLGVAALGILKTGALATALGATPDIHDDATRYLRYVMLGSPFLILSFTLNSAVRSDNRPHLAMCALAVGAVSNIILDYVFLYPLDMGIAGAALATALGPLFSVAIMLPHFLRGKGILRFATTQPSARLVRSILYLGVPAFVMEFSIGIVTFLYNVVITQHGFGEIGLAAYLMIGYIALIILTVFLGMAQGMQPLFSYFHGMGRKDRNRKLAAFLLAAAGISGIAMYTAVLLFSGPFIAAFTPGDTELIAFTREKAAAYFSGFAFAGVTIVIITFFQSVHKTVPALVLALLRSAVLVALFLYVFPKIWGRESIWGALSAAECVTCLVAWRLYGREKQARKASRRASGATGRGSAFFRS